MSACLALELSLTGQADEGKAWDKTFGENTWSEAKRLAMAVFNENQAVFRDFVITSKAEPNEQEKSQAWSLNPQSSVFDEDPDPGDFEKVPLNHQTVLSDSESGADWDAVQEDTGAGEAHK